MSFAPATSAHFALSASVARQDIWLPDAIHCRLDSSDILGFAQTPALLSWAPAAGLALQTFSTAQETPAWQIKRGDGHLASPVRLSPSANLALSLTPGVPYIFRLNGTAIAQTEVTITGNASVFGVIEAPGGPIRIAAKRVGPRHVISGRRLDYVLIIADRPTRLMRIKGVPQDSLVTADNRVGLFKRKFLNHALSVDALFQKSKRLTSAQQQLLLAAPEARSSLQRGLSLTRNAFTAAPLPMLSGALPLPGSPQAQLLHAGAQSRFAPALKRLTEMLDGALPQRAQKTASGAQNSGSTSLAETVLLHDLMLAAEDTFAATLLGRRLGLSFPEGGTGPVLISARAIWSVAAQDVSRLGALARFVVPNRAALKARLASDSIDPAGRILEAYIPETLPGPYLPIEARVLVDPDLGDDLPTAPSAQADDVPRPFNNGRDTRRVAITATTRPGAPLVLDRGPSVPMTRINPLISEETQAPGGQTIPERHGLIFGMTDPARTQSLPLGLASVMLSDREAPVADTPYALSQGDGFGRWSDFARLTAPAPDRPLPSKPTLRVQWRSASVQDGSGTLLVEVAAPHRGLIAPGGLPIRRLELAIPIAKAPDDHIEIEVQNLPATGEGLEPIRRQIVLPAPPDLGVMRQARVSATFHDTEQRAGPTAVARTQIPDPTPPPTPGPLPRLTQLSFPDANGVSRAEAKVPGLHRAVTSLRVFVATEASLRGGLLRLGDPAITAQIDAALAEPDLAKRAALFEAMAERIPTDVWAPAQRVPVTSGQAHISQPFNGLPRDLVSLKVHAVTDAGIESRDGALAFFGLPVQKPLSPPVIEARMLDSMRFELLIPRPSGPVPDEIRVLRSADSDAAARMLPSISVTAGPSAVWPLRLVDEGQTLLGPKAKLRRFTTYRWRAQARLAPRFEGAAPGPWTDPGPVTRALLAPPEKPSPPLISLQRNAAAPGGLTVAVKASQDGPLTLELSELPGRGQPKLVPLTAGEVEVALPADPTRTALQMRLLDPLERASDPVLIDVGDIP